MRDGWTQRQLGEVASIRQGAVLPVAAMTGGDHPVYGANGVIGWHFEGNLDHPTVALGCRGSCGTVNVVGPGAWLANNVMSVAPLTDDVSVGYLALVLENADLVSSGVIAGQVQQQITRQSLSPLLIPVPPFAEQRRIVDLITALDCALAASLNLAEQTARARRAVLQSMLDAGEPGWNQTTLGGVGKWYSGSTPKAGNPLFYGGEIPFLAIGDLAGGVVHATERTLTPDGVAQIGRVAPAGAVFVSMYGSIGKVGIAGRPMATNQAIAWLECDPTLCSPEFMLAWLSDHAERFDAQGRGATQRNINREMIKATPISLPSLAKQERIAGLVGVFDAVANRARAVEAHLARARETLLTDVLSGEHEIPPSYDALLEPVA